MTKQPDKTPPTQPRPGPKPPKTWRFTDWAAL